MYDIDVNAVDELCCVADGNKRGAFFLFFLREQKVGGWRRRGRGAAARRPDKGLIPITPESPQ